MRPARATGINTAAAINPPDDPPPEPSERVAMGVTMSTLVEVGDAGDDDGVEESVGAGGSVPGVVADGSIATAIVVLVATPLAAVVVGEVDLGVVVVGLELGLPGGGVAGGDVGAGDGDVAGGFVAGADPTCCVIVWLPPSVVKVTVHAPDPSASEPDVLPDEFVDGRLVERLPPGPEASTTTPCPTTSWPSSQIRWTL